MPGVSPISKELADKKVNARKPAAKRKKSGEHVPMRCPHPGCGMNIFKPAAKISHKLLPYLLSADTDEVEEEQSTSDEVELMGVAATAGVAAAMPHSAM
jgi:hypothetical protein